MSSISLRALSSPAVNVPTSATSAHARLPFVLGVALFITIAYMIPLEQSWKVSTIEHYAAAATDMEGGANEGVFGRQMVLLSLGLLGLVAIAWQGGRMLQVRGSFIVLCIAFLAWCAMSCLWADERMLTLRRFVALLCEVAAGIGIAKRTSPRQFVWIVFTCTAAWLALGILAELSLNTLRPWQEGYRFAGILHPNDMGCNIALLIMSATYLSHRKQRGRWLLWMVIAIAFVFLFFTRSRTSLGCTMLALATAWIVMAPRRYLVAVTLAGLLFAMSTLVMYGGQLMGTASDALAMGRIDDDASSLTGRLPLWEELLTYVAERPLIGYGYNGFWTVGHMREVSHAATWSVSIGHSSYIDLLLSIGAIGMVLCVVAILVAIVRATRLERRLPRAGYGFIAMMLGYMLLGSLSETIIGITWFASLFGICGLCQLTFADAHAALQLPRQEPPAQRSRRFRRPNFSGAYHAAR